MMNDRTWNMDAGDGMPHEKQCVMKQTIDNE